MSHGQQFTLYTHKGGPNGWKVAYVLQELGLTYHSIYLDFSKDEHKAPEYTKFNPNGRIPAIIDHKNNDFVLWESNAIILYLIEKYDPEHKISVTDNLEKHLLNQWLFFQASGQGPYFGQHVWFTVYHTEKVPSAVERYKNEIYRVLGVLESVLSKQEWLVGGKFTVADVSFLPWDLTSAGYFLKDQLDFEKEFPATYKWHNAVLARPAVQEVLAVKNSL